MEITITKPDEHKPVSLVRIQGSIDSTSYEQFQQVIEQAIAEGAHNMIIDLHSVPYLSSAGLRALNQVYNKLRAEKEDKDTVSKGVNAGTYKSPHLKLLAPNARVHETLKMSGFDMFLEIYTDLKSAIASF